MLASQNLNLKAGNMNLISGRERNNTKRIWQILAGLSLVALLSLAPAAKADTFQTYDVAWSGASLGNTASATGVITLDLTTLPNPSATGGSGLDGTDYVDISSDITSLSVTVTGAGAGNGTFTQANLCDCSLYDSETYWDTEGYTLNMTGNILPQLTADGGDFNLFFTVPGPQGSTVLTLTTDGLVGDSMVMTEFSPITSTPEPGPSSLLLSGVGLLGVMVMLRKRKVQGLTQGA